MRRVTRPGGTVGVYLWDYAVGMEMIRVFWDAAIEADASANSLDEAVRFPICDPDRLRDLFERSGLESIRTKGLWIPTVFADFDDFWAPFLGGQGPAPSYVATLTDDQRGELRSRLVSSLPRQGSSIPLRARAWAVSATV
jgi:hypothetical protein